MDWFTIYKGKKVTLPVTITDDDGAVVDITGKTLAFKAVDSWSSPTVTVTVTPTVLSGPDGTAQLPFADTDTASLTTTAGLLQLLYSLSVKDAGVDVVVDTGILNILDVE